MHQKIHVLSCEKDLWQIKFTWKWVESLCDPPGREQLSSWASPQILMPKCAIQNRLATLHLEYLNNPVFLTTYMQRIPLQFESVQMLN